MRTYHSLRIAASAITASTIASYCCATPTSAPTPRTFDYDITVPLFYNGQNVGSTVIPKGNSVEVISETETTITIRHMGNVLTITKPGKTPVATAPNVTAKPVVPEGTRDTSQDAEFARMSKIKPRVLPYPIMRVEIETDGSYTAVGFTTSNTHSYEKIGTKLRIYSTVGGAHIWEADEADTLETKVKTDPKLVEAIKTHCVSRGPGYYTYESYLEKWATKEKARVSLAPNPFAISQHTPLKEVLGLIGKRDPRMQSMVAAADKSPGLITWSDAPTNCEHIGMEAIAKELAADEKTPNRTAVSIRDQVEKLGVKHRRQIGDTCTLYSAYHLLDFHMKKGDIRPFTFEEFKAMVPVWADGNRRISHNQLLQILAKTQPGLKIRVREMPRVGSIQTSYYNRGCDEIYRAFIQHELAAGRPLWLDVSGHKVMLVGYNPDAKAHTRVDGEKLSWGQQFTALDSTGFGDDDQGYSRWDPRNASFAVSFEFIKPATDAAQGERITGKR